MKYAMMVLALVGVLARPTAAIAIADTSGNNMLNVCNQMAELCALYSAGWRNGQMATIVRAARLKGLRGVDAITADSKLYGVCFPRGVTYEQSGDVLIKYLQDHPKTRHKDMAVLASRGLLRNPSPALRTNALACRSGTQPPLGSTMQGYGE
jgi:hypothetical protein